MSGQVRILTSVLLCGALLAGCAQQPQAQLAAPDTAPGTATAATAATAAISNVQQRIDIYATVKLQADLTALSDAERMVLRHLVRAAQLMDDLYWQQNYGDRAALMATLADPVLRRLVDINYGPWDKLADERPLLTGIGTKPPGANLYPADITKDELKTLDVRDRDNAYSIVRRDAQRKLLVIPYSEAFKTPLARAAEELRQAAALTTDAAFKTYLNARAAALIGNDYRASDLAWMDMKSNHLDVIIGPVEDYLDGLQGVRTAFEGAVLLKDMAWSARLARFAKLLPALQRALPVPVAYKKETPGTDSELNAYDVLLYTGEANSSAKMIAINLPNDEAVQLQKGTRRLQLKNTMQAKFDQILKPIATALIASDQQANIRFDAFFSNIMFHEVAHGLGIKNTIDGKGTSRAALREMAGPLEEAKADILGLWLVSRLLASGELHGTTPADHYVTFVAGILRSVRFSAADAHGRANMIEFNYFADHGAFVRDAATGRYRVDVPKAQAATAKLAARILKIQGDGDYATAASALATEAVVRAQLQTDLERLSANNIPVDVVFEQGMKVLGLE
jgi:hypothetical protein